MESHARNAYITRKSFVFFILASVLNVVVIQANSIVNGIILGHALGPDALSAIGICTPVYEFATMVPEIIALGCMLNAARRLGAQDIDGVNKFFTTSIVSCLVVCGLIAIGLVGWAEEAATAYTTDPVLNRYVKEYLPWIGFIALTFAFQETLTNFLNLIGKPKFVIYISVGQLSVAILLNLLFVRVFHWEMAGAGAATMLSYLLSLLMAIPEALHDKNIFKLHLPLGKWVPSQLLKALKIGGASGMDGLTMVFLSLAINTVALALHGSQGVFVVTVFLQMLSICTLVTEGAGDTIETLGSVYMGEKDLKGYRLLFSNVMKIALGVLLAITVFTLIFPDALCFAFGAKEGLLDYAANPLRILSLTLIPFCLLCLLACNMTALGRLKITMFLNLGTAISIMLGVFISRYLDKQFFWQSIPLSILIFLIACFIMFVFIAKKEKTIDWYSLIPKHSEIPHIDFSVRYDNKDAADAINQINKFLDICELPKKVNYNVQSCVEEMMYNIIKRATAKQSKGYFDVRVVEILGENRSIRVSLKDHGTPFNPASKFNPDPDGKTLDLTLINELCHDINYNYSNSLNCTILNFAVEE